MHDYDRLKRLALAGDLDAAAALQREARRRADASAEALASAAQGDTASLIASAAAAWGAHDWPRLWALSDALGVPLSAADAARIDSLCDAANRHVRRRRVTHDHILRALSGALTDPDRYSAVNTGAGSGGARCVVALAVYDPDLDTVTLGVASASAQAGSPGSAWPSELAPWRPDLPTTQARLLAWRDAAAPDRVTLDRSVNAPHALLSQSSRADTERAGWLKETARQLQRASSVAWLRACQRLQRPPDPAAAAEVAPLLDQPINPAVQEARTGRRAWLLAALELGDEAGRHWERTHTLRLSNYSDPLLTSTCRAMGGVQSMSLCHLAAPSAHKQARAFAALRASPHLSALASLEVEGAHLNATSAHTLWGDVAALPGLRRLTLRALNGPPPEPWPPLLRALDGLSLHTRQPLDAGALLRWLDDAPAAPLHLLLDVGWHFPRHPTEPPPTIPWRLVRTESICLKAEQRASAEAITAALGGLDAPNLKALHLLISDLSPPILDALARVRGRVQGSDARPELSLRVGGFGIYRWQIQRGDLLPQGLRDADTVERLRAEVLPAWDL